MSYSEARANMKKAMDKVCESRKPLVITRKGGDPVVMLSLEDYESLDETAYLMSSPRNAERLRAALAASDRGEKKVFDSIEEMRRAAKCE